MQDYSNTKHIHAPFPFETLFYSESLRKTFLFVYLQGLHRAATLCVTWFPVMSVKETMKRLRTQCCYTTNVFLKE